MAQTIGLKVLIMVTNARRAIVTVGVGTRPDVGKSEESHLIGTSFAEKLHGFAQAFSQHSPDVDIVCYRSLPRHSPAHVDVPYAFKAFAIQELIRAGYRTLLWADSSVLAVRPLARLWELINEQGYWFSNNGDWTCGQWTCDSALEPLGITRDEAFAIPQIAATAFGFDSENGIACEFFAEYLRLARGTAFCGPWTNRNKEASRDPRVLGHRHDQTAASVIVWRLGLKTTVQPEFFSDARGVSVQTILVVRR